MLTISSLILIIAVSDISCFTLLTPKLLSRSNVVTYPLRSYQPSFPIQYYGRYVGDPYFSNMQNPYYDFSQDSYPYSSSFDDSEYYPNIFYYIPANRRISYYDQPVIEPMDDIQDYDEEEEDVSSKPSRDWWLEKNVLPDEETDFSDFNILDDLHLNKEKTPTRPRSKNKESKKKISKVRYDGIDGFGRKKDKEQVYGTYRINPRRDEERTWVYGVPVRSDFDDPDVRDLRSLLKEPKPEMKSHDYHNPDLTNWIEGNAKRSVDVKELKENSSLAKILSTLKPSTNLFPIYNEAGVENVPADFAENDNWSDSPEEPSVFDKIKKLLALEDKMNQQLRNKKSKSCDKCNFPSFHEEANPTTIKVLSDATTKVPEGGKNHKRSAEKFNRIVSDDETLARQLNALKHMRS